MAGNYFLKMLLLLILGVTIGSATERTYLEGQADYVVKEIKVGKAIPEDTLRSIVGRSKGDQRVFESLEDLTSSMEGFLDTNDLDPRYRDAAKPFVMLVKTEYDRILADNKEDPDTAAREADPLAALLWEVTARLMPPPKKEE